MTGPPPNKISRPRTSLNTAVVLYFDLTVYSKNNKDIFPKPKSLNNRPTPNIVFRPKTDHNTTSTLPYAVEITKGPSPI